MSMGVGHGSGDGDDAPPISDINVTPLVDVMLVLLIIFMITAPLMMQKLPLELPKVRAEEAGKPKEPLIVGVDKTGQFFIGTDPVPADQVLPRLQQIASDDPETMVYVQGDKNNKYSDVLGLLATIGKAGLANVSLMAQTPE
ncbi:MAG: biopolymer transporter ExbD [Pseudomonadota bacterium]